MREMWTYRGRARGVRASARAGTEPTWRLACNMREQYVLLIARPADAARKLDDPVNERVMRG